MAKKKEVYSTCKVKVRAIQEAYDALVDAVEDYKALLTTLIDEANPEDESDKHLLVVANLQRNTTNGLRMGCRFIYLQTNVLRLGLRHSGKIHPEKAMFIPSSHSFTLYRRWDKNFNAEPYSVERGGRADFYYIGVNCTVRARA